MLLCLIVEPTSTTPPPSKATNPAMILMTKRALFALLEYKLQLSQLGKQIVPFRKNPSLHLMLVSLWLALSLMIGSGPADCVKPKSIQKIIKHNVLGVFPE